MYIESDRLSWRHIRHRTLAKPVMRKGKEETVSDTGDCSGRQQSRARLVRSGGTAWRGSFERCVGVSSEDTGPLRREEVLGVSARHLDYLLRLGWFGWGCCSWFLFGSTHCK